MSLDVNKSVMDLHLDDPDFQSSLEQIKIHLDKCISYSTHVLFQCAQNAKDNDVDIVMIKLLKNAFQLLDGASILLENGCEKPTEPLLRSVIETIASISFIQLFFERIEPVFASAEKEAEEYQNNLWDDLMNQPCSEDDAIDPSGYVDSIQEAAFEKYEILSLMQYRNIGMWISCMSQVWEQQLFSFIVNEARSEGVKYSPVDLKRGYAFSKHVFEWHNSSFEKLACWPKVHELHLLVNVLKHAEGDSEQKLRKIRPDYFVQKTSTGEYDLLRLYHSTLLEATLQISNKDFVEYYNSLVAFWNELPERMYTTDEI
jgi:hypothetical protein